VGPRAGLATVENIKIQPQCPWSSKLQPGHYTSIQCSMLATEIMSIVLRMSTPPPPKKQMYHKKIVITNLARLIWNLCRPHRPRQPQFAGLKFHKHARNTKLYLGRAMAQAVSRRPLTAEARVRSRASPCGICGGQSGTGQVFPRVLRFSPVNFIPPVLNYTIFITGLRGPSQKKLYLPVTLLLLHKLANINTVRQRDSVIILTSRNNGIFST
jgi:hypothetical protein